MPGPVSYLSSGPAVLLFLLLQFVSVGLLPGYIVLGEGFFDSLALSGPMFNASLVNMTALVLGTWVMHRFQRHPRRHPSAYILPVTMTTYAVLLLILVATHAPISVKALLLGFLMVLVFQGFNYLLERKRIALRLYYLPLGNYARLRDTANYKFRPLRRAVRPTTHIDGVVVDFHSAELSPVWQRFLAACALDETPVYEIGQVCESISGRVELDHLNENDLGQLAPSKLSQELKWLVDVAFLFAMLPLLVPIMTLIGLCIVLDSPGGAFFVQERIGYLGKTFRVLKFRSMVVDHGGAHFTGSDESHRITRVGRIIRRYRLDELPQFWNVLRGEMSLIGPRPESSVLAEWYAREVPFFAYRHVVRPGISGWAQVMQGYAAGVDEVRDKLGYDFYYIKHFSPWLDLLVWYKTIRTVVTGFGSR